MLTQDVQLNHMWKCQRYCQVYNEPCKPQLHCSHSSTRILKPVKAVNHWRSQAMFLCNMYSGYCLIS